MSCLENQVSFIKRQAIGGRALKRLGIHGWISFIVLAAFLNSHAAKASAEESCGYEKSRKHSFYESTQVEFDQYTDSLSLDPITAYVQKLSLRINGVPAAFASPRFSRAVKLVKQGDYIGAAQTLAQDDNFLSVRVKTFAAPFSSKDLSPIEPFNDLQALIIGVVRDELDARTLLTGDIRYQGYKSTGLPAPSLANNDHYLQFDAKNYNYATDLERVNKQWESLGVAAGAFTTRAWSVINYDAGTNRRSLKNGIEVFLCTSIDTWKVRGAPDYFVRRDVDRAPGGNPATYQNTCRNCHALMDGMAGAFARFDLVDGVLTYLKSGVAAKMNQNGNVYNAGFVTVDDSWTNLTKYNNNIDFGWRSPMTGQGVPELAHMLAQSSAFSRCMVTKVFTEVCGGSIQEIAPEMITPLTADFESRKYNLKYLFTKTASLNQCLAHPKMEFRDLSMNYGELNNE